MVDAPNMRRQNPPPRRRLCPVVTAVGQWRWSLVSEDDGMPMNTDPLPAATFVLTFRPSVSDKGFWFRRRWIVAMVADL
ncbi:hypothetical protein Hanom_Chr14g01270461 [Helianthus anomalus]